MYRCQKCKKVAPPKTTCHKVVTSKRSKVYPSRRGVNRPIMIRDETGRKRYRSPDDPGGVGWEAAVETLMCPPCARRYQEAQTEFS